MTNIFIERWLTDKNQTLLYLFYQFDDIRGKNTSFGKNKFFMFTFYFVLTWSYPTLHKVNVLKTCDTCEAIQAIFANVNYVY